MSVPRKPAPAEKAIVQPIVERWSPVGFDPRPVEAEKIATFFEAARWAPSSYNEQPWRYVYALKGDPNRDALESLLVEGNAWAKNAGVLLIAFARKNFQRNDRPNRFHLHDTGAATGYLALQLHALGLIGHQMEGFDWEGANALLRVPEAFVPASMMAIGYPADPLDIPAQLREREEAPRTRKPVEEFAFRGMMREPKQPK